VYLEIALRVRLLHN